MKILYKTRATAIGGRSGNTMLDDGSLSLDLAMPGTGKAGANPEQLFALGYAACFDNALKHVAERMKLPLASSQTSAEVGMGMTPEGGFKLDVDLYVTLGGLDQASAEALLAKGHAVCPYSNALHGNVDVRLHLTVA
ncbi:MAG: organic hydroperoxide resistance protein [Gammaproteobacteria bacterium]|nr:organic hydroperoxide resistance protein [Gammaproteobacteria bacterium]